jgi:hypothetical protein
MAVLHCKDNPKEDCKRLVRIDDDHVFIDGPYDDLLSQWLQESNHNICYECFTTVVINDIDITK